MNKTKYLVIAKFKFRQVIKAIIWEIRGKVHRYFTKFLQVPFHRQDIVLYKYTDFIAIYVFYLYLYKHSKFFKFIN